MSGGAGSGPVANSGANTQPPGTAAASGSDSLGGKNAGSGGTEPSGGSGGNAAGASESSSAGDTGSGGDPLVGGAGTSGPEPVGCSPACEGGSICRNGVCACNGGLAYCNRACIDTKTDDEHCGSGCGVACTAGRKCVAGACKCPWGEFCDGACFDTTSDPAHCGGCNNTCQGASECLNGACKACSTGCAVLIATVTDNSTSPFVRYGIALSQPIDLIGAVITARMFVASNVYPSTVQLHIDDTTDSSSTGMYVANKVDNTGWFIAEMFVTAATHIDSLDVWLQDFSGVGSAVVYLDSITVSNGVAGPWEFTSSAAPLTYSLGVGVDPSDISGSVSWRNN